MGIQDRKNREKNRLKKEILKAAKDLFYQHGYHSVSMRKIAKKIEYSPTTIYNYYQSKADILTQIVYDYFHSLNKKGEIILQEKEIKPYSTLYKYLFFYIQNGINHPEQYRFLASIFSSPEKLTLGNTSAHISYQQIEELVQMCIDQHIFTITDSKLITQSLWSVLYGLTLLLVTRPDFDWIDKKKLIHHTLKMNLEGLKNRNQETN